MFASTEINDDYAIYIHIPFCHRKCPYCDFYVRTDANRKISTFYQVLVDEFELRKHEYLKFRKPYSLFLGGGTPSIADPKWIHKFINYWVVQGLSTNDEITCEVNPEDERSFPLLFESGVNRLSIGIQSLNQITLQSLGRNHSQEQAINAIQVAKKCGFMNISVDLLCGLPFEDTNDYQRTLKQIIELTPQHISVYILSIPTASAFGKRLEKGQFLNANEEKVRFEFEHTIEFLSSNGYDHYEVSNFSQPSSQSKHNLAYWTGRRYFGFGPSSHSYDGTFRYSNVSNFDKWTQSVSEKKSPFDFQEKLSIEMHRTETIAMGLRLSDGLNVNDTRLNIDTNKVEQLIQKKWVKRVGKNLVLTPEGFLIENSIIQFLL